MTPDEIRSAALEEAAREAEHCRHPKDRVWSAACDCVAENIRALKSDSTQCGDYGCTAPAGHPGSVEDPAPRTFTLEEIEAAYRLARPDWPQTEDDFHEALTGGGE
jgi:hypothetical protein